MPQPLAICLEDLAAAPAARYLRCVALAGRQPGLRLDAHGDASWQCDGDVAAELWVSADDRLILYRPEGAPAVRVGRAGRFIEAPEGKPVVLLGGDEIAIGPRQLRVHVHGAAPAVAPPTPLAEPTRRVGSGVAAVVAMGMAVAGCKDVEVRQHPPAPPLRPTDTAPVDPSSTVSATASATATQTATSTAAASTTTDPIEVRDHPPEMAVPDDDPESP